MEGLNDGEVMLSLTSAVQSCKGAAEAEWSRLVAVKPPEVAATFLYHWRSSLSLKSDEKITHDEDPAAHSYS